MIPFPVFFSPVAFLPLRPSLPPLLFLAFPPSFLSFQDRFIFLTLYFTDTERVFCWLDDICVLREKGCVVLLIWLAEFKGNFWNPTLMNASSPEQPLPNIVVTEGAAVTSIELELACTSRQEPGVCLSGIVQTGLCHISSVKTARVGTFTPQELASATNQGTPSPFLSEGAGY